MLTPSPDNSFWLSSLFEWIRLGVSGLLTAFVGLLWWVFKRHLKEDDLREENTLKRFDVREEQVNGRFMIQEALIERRHAENVAGRESLRTEILKSSENAISRTDAMRGELLQVLLQLSAQIRDK